jgi:hypothetical protein
LVIMTIASRLYAGLAALALLFAGVAAVVPSPAQAQDREVATALIVGGVVTAAIIAAVVLLDGEDDDEGPQSP